MEIKVFEEQIKTESNKIKLAICGIRGIPACYGGFETFAQELSIRLVNDGFEVRVYGRKHLHDKNETSYRGVQLCQLWAPRHKYLETPVHTLLCMLHVLINRVDVVLVCNAANSPFIWLLRLFLIPVAVNVDGIERKRAKWNWLGRLWYRLGEICSVLFASRIVADADVIQRYYSDSYNAKSDVIRYGYNDVCSEIVQNKSQRENISGEQSNTVTISNAVNSNIFQEFSLNANNYLLYVSRLEPENNAHVVIEAYGKLPSQLQQIPLVIVGDAPYAKDYKRRITELAKGLNVIFTGFRFGPDYQALQLGALIYIQATEVGGTHPALVEAMGFANCIVANKTPENLEVLSDAGHFYLLNDSNDLSIRLHALLRDRKAVLVSRKQALLRAKSTFSWDTVTQHYKQLFVSLTR